MHLDKLETLWNNLRHHGVLRTGFAYTLKTLKRLVTFNIMVVEATSGGPTGTDVTEPYITRQITAKEYSEGISWLGKRHDRLWAFERGDRCFANLMDARLVGYQFYSSRSTPIRPGLEFVFPDSLTYAYGSFTHPDYRGRRLATLRANARQKADQARGIKRELVWYVALDNLASHAANQRLRPRRIGYIGYARIGRRYLCYASGSCKRIGVSIVPTSG